MANRLKKFRKRPVVVEAMRWYFNGDHPLDHVSSHTGEDGYLYVKVKEGELVRYYRSPDIPGTKICDYCKRRMHDHGWIETLEGGHIVCPGDWIVTGISGEHYPVKPHIFANTYDPINEEEANDS